MKKVLLFLAKGFEAYEASVFTDVIGWTRELGIDPVDLKTTGFRTTIPCYWNLIAQPEILYDEVNVDDYDALAIPGGGHEAGFFEDAYDERFLNLIREFDAKGKIIASICVGAMPVGKSGVLKNRKATTWDLNEGHRRKQLTEMGVNVQDKQLVVDNNIITSTGPATSLDVAFKLLEMLTNEAHVLAVKKDMRFIVDNK
ncbi:DJ-1/PfpI family protein [Carboxylicivirga sp. N1Y90]|uniref:DJ-1/PfpI family protein n=1 Tax=Carboxylicivirga fragile TaxID=3417571 RepID=UPI003D324E7E|nr:DJ-1/PfpI family protein [Marinilabiliaceae bacterium N1Y90]